MDMLSGIWIMAIATSLATALSGRISKVIWFIFEFLGWAGRNEYVIEPVSKKLGRQSFQKKDQNFEKIREELKTNKSVKIEKVDSDNHKLEFELRN